MSPPKRNSERPPGTQARKALSLDLDEVEATLGLGTPVQKPKSEATATSERDTQTDPEEAGPEEAAPEEAQAGAGEDNDRPTVAPPFDLETFAKEGGVASYVIETGSLPPMRAPQATLTDEDALAYARDLSKMSNFPSAVDIVDLPPEPPLEEPNAKATSVPPPESSNDALLSLVNSRAPSIVPPAARPAHAWTAVDRGWGEELDEPESAQGPGHRPASARTDTLSRAVAGQIVDPMGEEPVTTEDTPMPNFARVTPVPRFSDSVASVASVPSVSSVPSAAATVPSLEDEAPTSRHPNSAEPPPPPQAESESKRTPTLRPVGPESATPAAETPGPPPAKPFIARRKTQVWGMAGITDSSAPSSGSPVVPSDIPTARALGDNASSAPPAGASSQAFPTPAANMAAVSVKMPEQATPFPTSKGARDLETARAETQAVASSSPVTLAANMIELQAQASQASHLPTASTASAGPIEGSSPRVTPVAVPRAENVAASRPSGDDLHALDAPDAEPSGTAGTASTTKKKAGESLAPITLLESSPPPTRKAATDPILEMKERFSLGDYTGALVIAEALLDDNPSHTEAKEYAESCRQVLQQMYTARIGPLDRVPMVMVPRDQLRWLSIDHKAGFVLSHVDGISSLEMILDVSGMPTLDTLRILCELAQQRIISFR